MSLYKTKFEFALTSIVILVFTVSVCLSCAAPNEDYLDNINGYWQIQEVTLSNGSKKTYNYNETIDYISINDSLVGFRKKLKPLFNNKYLTTQDAEGIVAKIENDSLNLYYKTPYATWKETILMADENYLKISNAKKDVYLYKRYKGLKLDIN